MNLDIEIGSNALKELSERMKWKVDAFSADEVFADSIANPSDEEERKAASFFNEYVIAQRIIAELAKVNHGEASPTPWRAHTDREVRANDERLWIEDVVCQTQSCPKTRYTKAEREEWNIPATANTKLIVASVNAVARCREIAEEGAGNGK